MTINAFSPEYVQTHMPEFLTKMRIESSQHAYGVINGGKARAAREAKLGGKYVNTINLNQETKPKGKK